MLCGLLWVYALGTQYRLGTYAIILLMANSKVVLSGSNSDGDQYSVSLTVSDNKWTKSEPSGANKVFATASGVWSRAVNITTLFKADGTTRVGQFTPLVPESAKKGDSGTGDSFET